MCPFDKSICIVFLFGILIWTGVKDLIRWEEILLQLLEWLIIAFMSFWKKLLRHQRNLLAKLLLPSGISILWVIHSSGWKMVLKLTSVVEFVDRYVTRKIPSVCDEEMHAIVSSVQQHSWKHPKTCNKKGAICHFSSPSPPSGRNFIIQNNCSKAQTMVNTEPNEMAQEGGENDFINQNHVCDYTN